jgi:hypothetical protein
MQFRTIVPIRESNRPIGYDSQILSLGSCFAVNIAEKLDYSKFRSHCNPFGILFHPLAICEIIRKSISGEAFTEADMVSHNGLWHSLDAHSDLSHPDKTTLLENLNAALKTTRESIQKATHLIITYGTAWVYRHKDSRKLVANCHKIPQSQFEKELLSVETMREAMQQTVDLIRGVNPDCHIIFTVSPVRHIKDGFVENQRSKAHLIAAIHSLENGCDYFPSYEIVMDELRDYRFYASDMLHPNQTAIDYIWEKFSAAHISEDSAATMHEIDSIRKGLSHKPFHPDSESHRQFVAKLSTRIDALRKQLPYIDF